MNEKNIEEKEERQQIISFRKNIARNRYKKQNNFQILQKDQLQKLSLINKKINKDI